MKRFLPIFLIVLVDIFGLTLVIPLLAIYAEKFHATPLQATLLVSVFAACQLVSGPLLGRISDSTGRKPMLIVSQIGTVIGFLVMASASSLWMLYVARIIDGATAGNISLAQAYISDNTAPENRAKSFAIIGISFGLGFFIGPFVTGYLTRYGLNAPIYLAAALSFTSMVITATMLPGGKPPQAAVADGDPGPGGRRLSVLSFATYTQYFQRPVLSGLLVQFFCYILAFSLFVSGFALFSERRFTWNGQPFGPREIGFLFAYSGFLGILLQGGLVGRLVKRLGEPRLIAIGFATLCVSYVGLGLVTDIKGLLAVSTLASFGNAVVRPVLSSLVSQRAARHEQGVVLGLNQSLNSVAQIIAPIIGGLLIERGMLGPWAWAAAVASLAGFIGIKWGSGRVLREPAMTT